MKERKSVNEVSLHMHIDVWFGVRKMRVEMHTHGFSIKLNIHQVYKCRVTTVTTYKVTPFYVFYFVR